MKVFSMIFTMVFTLALGTNAFAGEWTKGHGKSISEALENAASLAGEQVESRGQGCVDGQTRDLTKVTTSGIKIWSVEIYVHHQNGLCSIEVNEEWIQETSAKLAEEANQPKGG